MNGRIPLTSIFMALSLAIVLILVLFLYTLSPGGPGDDAPSIRVACAAGIKPPVEEAAARYEESYGVSIEFLYGGSATLLGGLAIKPDSADLYIAADSSYIQDGRSKGLLRESIPLAQLTPVIAVAKGNPKDIQSIDTLIERTDIRIGLANPDAAAAGRATRQLLEASGDWDAFEQRITVLKPTVVDIANDVALGAIDASILWDATVAQYDELEAIDDPRLSIGSRTIEVAVVEESSEPTEALRFARYLGAADRGQEVFAQRGYVPTEGDLWSERPRIVLFAGSMFNQAVEETLTEFVQREGVDVERIYNGCGILVGQIRAGAQPDAYLSCDVRFMDAVQERFLPSTDLSQNPLVIIVQAGNPKDIRDLEDLAGENLRVGLAHPEKSALGAITNALLREQGHLETITTRGNWVQEAPQGDFLVNAMRTGALDAALVYASNAANARGDVQVIPFDSGGYLARQPWAIARSSKNAQTLSRLLVALQAERSAQRFRDLGFMWMADHAEDDKDRETP